MMIKMSEVHLASLLPPALPSHVVHHAGQAGGRVRDGISDGDGEALLHLVLCPGATNWSSGSAVNACWAWLPGKTSSTNFIEKIIFFCIDVYFNMSCG